MLFLKHLLVAFGHSKAGLAWAFRHEWAVRMEVFALAAALLLGVVLAENLWSYVALVGSVLLVLAVELLNTAVEKLCDHVMPDRHPTIGLVKDLGSAAVLVSMGIAGLIWAVALWRYVTGG
jgi:diacylglycerol kinase (ATP)